MTFEKYLSDIRGYQAKIKNPGKGYADDLLDELDTHLQTVKQWINGSINRDRMSEAMHFFGTRYSAKGKIYRGMEHLVFDGKPASYTKKLELAEGFALAEVERAWLFKSKAFYVAERLAPSNSLDLSKLLRDYAEGKIERSEEAEVIVYNTPVAERNITEYSLEGKTS